MSQLKCICRDDALRFLLSTLSKINLVSMWICLKQIWSCSLNKAFTIQTHAGVLFLNVAVYMSISNSRIRCQNEIDDVHLYGRSKFALIFCIKFSFGDPLTNCQTIKVTCWTCNSYNRRLHICQSYSHCYLIQTEILILNTLDWKHSWSFYNIRNQNSAGIHNNSWQLGPLPQPG